MKMRLILAVIVKNKVYIHIYNNYCLAYSIYYCFIWLNYKYLIIISRILIKLFWVIKL